MVHTTPYDLAVMADSQSGHALPAQGAVSVTMPTLIMDGENSEPWQHHSARALADLLPDARWRTFPGADHGIAPDALVPVLHEFFTGP
jgi:pimeloyl-ACP methyl ester carboxylesterase